MSICLFHGPRARTVALERATAYGRFLRAFDDLKVEATREIVDCLSTPPIGDGMATLLIGPLDEATPDAADSLLKILEEHNAKYIQPFLWALDLSFVIPTIRSRTLQEWCPPEDPKVTPEAPYLATATSLCESALKHRTAAVIESLEEHRGQELEIMRAAAEVLSKKTEWSLKRRLTLWESLREILSRSTEPSHLAVVTAFMI